ncbi:MAG: monovalent cation/hydrogen antiporter [Gaiellales bacterium]|nr:monovalent cation/hydrogen antiporter [Gaiellales bacterium]
MSFSAQDSLVLLALLVAAATLLVLAPVLRIPYPILLVLGGLGIGFVPGAPHIALQPEIVLVGFLPPLLYSGAFFTSLRDLRTNARAISLLSVGLVLATMLTVAAVCHTFIDGLSWPICFVIGAIVAPTDAVAATAIASRLGLPRRIVALIEGESLINDATALVAYAFAVAAVVTGTFSLWHATWRFGVDVAGGVAIGLAVGFVIRQARRRINQSPTEIAIALLSGYFAYLPAEAAGVSAVLAVVTVGIYVGWYTPELTTFQTRLQGDAVWEILTFLLNAVLFGLVGLQLRPIIDSLQGRSTGSLIADGAIVSAAVILTRLVWIYPATYLPRWMWKRIRERDPYPPWQYPTLIGWAGLRGAVSLAAALALPLTTDSGQPFPQRAFIIYIAFCVIMATLVLQGLTLPAVIRMLRLEDDGVSDKEETKARIHAAEAALGRLEELAGEDWVRPDTAERLRGAYRFRASRFAARFDDEDDGQIEERSQSYQRLRRELLDAERNAVLDLRRQGRINDAVMNRVQRDLDLEDARLDV